jgi:hypothetical protein
LTASKLASFTSLHAAPARVPPCTRTRSRQSGPSLFIRSILRHRVKRARSALVPMELTKQVASCHVSSKHNVPNSRGSNAKNSFFRVARGTITRGIYVDQAPRRPYGTNVANCSGYLLAAAGERTGCARPRFPKVLHRATSHIFDSDRGPNATRAGR